MFEEISFLGIGLILGIAWGFTPGPLFTLVISETLKYGPKEGMKVGIAPLLTDVPVIFLSFSVVLALSNINFLLGLISLFGSLVMVYYGYETISIKNIKVDLQNAKPQSIRKGVITNYLNPHMYVSHFVVTGPIIVKALKINILSPVLFVAGFMLTLVLSKIFLALVAHKSRYFMNSKSYIYTLKILGIVMIIFAFIFFMDGLKYFKFI